MDTYSSDNYYKFCLKSGLLPDEENSDYCLVGKTLRINEEFGHGTYWIYEHKNLFNIRIHDFYFKTSQTLTFRYYNCMSITKYYEITGTELPSGRKLTSGCLKSFIGQKDQPYSIMIPANARISSVCIEILPAFYKKYIKNINPDEYQKLIDAFVSFDQSDDFPEMSALLSDIKNFRGEGLSAQLYYNAKVSEAMSLMINYRHSSLFSLKPIDRERIHNVTEYIDNNFSSHITIGDLEKVAFMGATKLQNSFRTYHNCTITAYIQSRRIEKAKLLLQTTSLPVNEIAIAVGYKKSSQFSEIFKKLTGTLPLKYRKSCSNV